MKLLIISAAFPPMAAGEADHALHLSRHLADRGLDVHVLTTRGHVGTPNFPFKVHSIMRDWSWRDLPRLARFLKSCKPDVVLLWYLGWIYNEHPMITFAATVSKLLLPRVVFVTQFANVQGAHEQQRGFVTRLFRKGVKLWSGERDVDYEHGTLLRDSDRVIVLSDHHRAALSRIYPALDSKSVLIPPPPIMTMCPEDNGYARRRGRETLGVKSNEFLLVYLGYIYPAKGIEILLKAFGIVSAKRSNIKLVLVGGIVAHADTGASAYNQYLIELAKQLGIDDRIRWTGGYSWDGDDASSYLRAADAFVLPTNLGLQLNNSTFAAAAAHGLPIIATRGPIVETQFIHEENVILCPLENPEVMAAAIEALMDDPSLRQRLRMGALQLAGEWFSWEKAIERTVETFTGSGTSRLHGETKSKLFQKAL